MKVNELVKALSNYPPNKEVMVIKSKHKLPIKVNKVIYNPNIDIVFIDGEKE